ncbi:Holliday junction resolvase RuvX [Pontimonas sp.]|nr:Holliday junction resolvase RuvX [Pontimonas sp.]
MRRGVRLGVDVGKARVGVASCDPDGLLATPVETLPRAEALSSLVQLAQEREPLEIVVGLPIGLSGGHTASTDDAEQFARKLAELVAVPVRLIDERLSTVQAASGLRAAGRSAKNQREVIDQAAAVILLQHAVDSEKARGVPPGQLLVLKGNDA